MEKLELKQLQMMENYSTTELPGFQSCCLDEWVLRIAAIGLRNRKNKRYTSMNEQGQTAKSQYKALYNKLNLDCNFRFSLLGKISTYFIT